jgi:hypothetical protein
MLKDDKSQNQDSHESPGQAVLAFSMSLWGITAVISSVVCR